MNGKLMLYIDQYGRPWWARTVGDLTLQVNGRPGKASTMYADKKDGTTVRSGYVIGHHWLTRYAPVELPA